MPDVRTSGYTVEVFWGNELPGIGDAWRWWWDCDCGSDALIEQQRLEYFHGHAARIVPRTYWRDQP